MSPHRPCMSMLIHDLVVGLSVRCSHQQLPASQCLRQAQRRLSELMIDPASKLRITIPRTKQTTLDTKNAKLFSIPRRRLRRWKMNGTCGTERATYYGIQVEIL